MTTDSPATGTAARLKGILKSLRPHQWVKNAFVLAPVVFSLHFDSLSHVGRSIGAALAFSLLSGAVYLLNDIADIEADRAHPVKKNRPIASGLVPVKLARWLCLGLLVVALGMAVALNPWFGLVAASYFVINLAYSAKLKHVPFIDVGIIATGFLLRVLAGSLAIEVPVSTWLFLVTFLLSLYLALGKRRHEVRLVGRSGTQRKVLKSYNATALYWAMIVVGGLTVAAYTAYTLDPHTPISAQLSWPKLVLTVPFTLFGVGRFFLLTNGKRPKSPTEQMLKDVPFLINMVAWVVVVFALLLPS